MRSSCLTPNRGVSGQERHPSRGPVSIASLEDCPVTDFKRDHGGRRTGGGRRPPRYRVVVAEALLSAAPGA
jgi:hypothetical protein